MQISHAKGQRLALLASEGRWYGSRSYNLVAFFIQSENDAISAWPDRLAGASQIGSSDVYLIVQLGTSVFTFWTPLMRLRCSDWKRR